MEENKDERKELHDSLMSQLPHDFRSSSSKIEMAYGLFGEQNGVRPHIRVLLGTWNRETDPPTPDRSRPQLRIILDERLCLFFTSTSGAWLFDGWEAGNYEGYWTEFDITPNQPIEL